MVISELTFNRWILGSSLLLSSDSLPSTLFCFFRNRFRGFLLSVILQ